MFEAVVLVLQVVPEILHACFAFVESSLLNTS